MDGKKLTQTQEAIHKSAKEHFLKYGFQKASLNQIISDTGFTKGAFYGYYDSKEELFCALVQDTVDGIEKILKAIAAGWQQYPRNEQVYHMTDEFLLALPELVDYIFEHHDEVVLLLKCADGTRYGNFLENLQISNEQEGQGNLQSTFGEALISERTYGIMMSGYFSMLKSVFLSDMSRDEMIAAITDIQIMFQTGIMSLAQSKAKGGGFR